MPTRKRWSRAGWRWWLWSAARFGPAALVGVVATLTAGVVVDSVALVVVALSLAVTMAIVRRRRAAQPARSTD